MDTTSERIEAFKVAIGYFDRIRRHKLITKADVRKIPALRSTDGQGDSATAWIKLFNPTGRETWFVTEIDITTGEAFGLVVGQEAELGYFNVFEIGCLRGAAGLPIERDKWFTPTTIGEIRNGRNN